MHPYRSLLFVPAHRDGWVEKALRVDLDALILDLEDAVPSDAKTTARNNLADATNVIRSRAPHVGVLVRCNSEDAATVAHDLEAIVAAGVDAVLIPKVNSPTDVMNAVVTLRHVAAKESLAVPEVMVSLESAAGLLCAGAIVAQDGVTAALCAAAKDGDVARSVGFTWTPEGLETLGFRSQAVLACRAVEDRHPVVGLWQDVGDLDGLARFAADNAALGFGGQVVIHPSHVEAVNLAYAPSPALLDHYRSMLDAWDDAAADEGAVRFRGEHIDVAHVATARSVVDRADRLSR